MHRKKQSSGASRWHHKTATIANMFLLMTGLFFVTPSIAATNAKGIEIAFLFDEVLSDPSIAPLPVIPLPVVPNNIWLRIEQGYAMPETVSAYTKKYEDFYAERPEYVEKMMERTEKYLFYVVEEVEKRGMPTEIALLPMIESAYNPQAYSRSHAVGMWQFVPLTGKYFGLEQNWWADHRRDVTASTQAALDYLEKLHGMFGSWDLALAAYNAGEGTVSRAITHNAKAGLPTDYASLNLPPETEQYVPKLQAIKNIITNPQQYGLTINIIPNQPYFAEVDPPYQIDAKLVAQLAGISDEEFGLLNPSYKRPIIASKNHSHKILLPVATVDIFKANLASHDASLTNWSVYNAKSGEDIASIASKFGISLERLRDINSLPKGKHLTNPLHLLVPLTEVSAEIAIDIAQLAAQKMQLQTHIKPITHKIKRGETLSAVAKKYGTNTKTLMKVNRLTSSKIKAGQIIKIKATPERAKTKTI